MAEVVLTGRIGFTGTQHGLTDEQRRGLANLLALASAHELHHGDCIGADASAGAFAWRIGMTVVVHPPDDPSKRAFKLPFDEIREEKPYLERNKDIVRECDVLLACPHTSSEQLRSGTWATVRYARAVGKPIVILWPDGTIEQQ